MLLLSKDRDTTFCLGGGAAMINKCKNNQIKVFYLYHLGFWEAKPLRRQSGSKLNECQARVATTFSACPDMKIYSVVRSVIIIK